MAPSASVNLKSPSACDAEGADRAAARHGGQGLLTRKVYAEVPPRVEYTLTETGYSLKPILDSMVVWGTNYKEKAAAMEDDDAPDEA